MDDLVKRLRDVQDNWPLCDIELEAADRIEALWEVFQETTNKWHDALDRIEALETALRQICDGPRNADKSYAELFAEVCWEARAALGEKKDD